MFWSPSGAETFVVIVVVVIIIITMHVADIKISMVGIHKVKVRLPPSALAHVSHFFSHMLQSVHCR